MPPTTYGLLAVHPSHRITNPDPARAARAEMPDACTLCHTDRTVAWAAHEARRQYGPNAAAPPDDRAAEIAESIRTLLGGDVLQRTVAVNALVRDVSYTSDPVARLWAVPFLLLTMEDRYPAVRHFAYRGLASLYRRAQAAGDLRWSPPLPDFDYLAETPVRDAALARCWSWWQALDRRGIPHPGPAVPLDAELMPIRAAVAPLTAQQSRNVIAIGE